MSLNLEIRSYRGGGRHRHGFAQILFPLRGSMQVDIEGTRVSCRAIASPSSPRGMCKTSVPSRDCNLLVMEVEATDLDDDQALAVLRSDASRFIAVEPWLWRLFTMLGAEIASDPRHAEKIGPVAMTGLQLLRPMAPTPVETAPTLRVREPPRGSVICMTRVAWRMSRAAPASVKAGSTPCFARPMGRRRSNSVWRNSSTRRSTAC